MTDPLRKAAEELIKEWDWECGEHQNKALTELIEALRQALAQPEWVGLTDEDKHFLLATAWNKEQAFDGFMDAIDKFLEEKNT